MSGVLQVVFLEVGHGDSIVIIYPDGKTATIIDTPNSKITFDFIEKQGIACVDWVIVSHGDSDHYKGVASLIANLQDLGIGISKLGYIRGDKSIRREPGYNRLRRQFAEFERKHGIECIEPYSRYFSGSIASSDEVNLNCIFPHSPADVDLAGDEPNNWSIVLVLEHENYKVLLPGDLEGKGWYVLKNKLDAVGKTLQADVFKLPHHGRWFSSGPECLGLDTVIDMVDAPVNIISAGYHERLSCHSTETIRALKNVKHFSRVLCTGSGKTCHNGKVLDGIPLGITLGKSTDGKSTPCAGTITVTISKGGIDICPSKTNHIAVISKLKNPICIG